MASFRVGQHVKRVRVLAYDPELEEKLRSLGFNKQKSNEGYIVAIGPTKGIEGRIYDCDVRFGQEEFTRCCYFWQLEPIQDNPPKEKEVETISPEVIEAMKRCGQKSKA